MSNDNLFLLNEPAEDPQRTGFFLGTIVTADSAAGTVTLQLDGMTEANQKSYKTLSSAWPLSANDRVVLMKKSGTYVVMGKIGIEDASAEPSTTTPKMDGAATVGTETKYARGDHVHPSDTGKVSKAGDTMTGALGIEGVFLNLKNTDLQDSVYPAQTSWGSARVIIRDKLNTFLGQVCPQFDSSRQGIRIHAQKKINGSDTYNALVLSFDSTGNRVVSFSSSAPWRKALGLGDADGALPLTIAQGGSGQTQVDSVQTVSDIATAGSNISITAAYYCQWGKLAMIEIFGSATASISSGSVVFTLVEGKRPALESPAQVWLSTNYTSVIKQNGEILIGGSNLSSGSNLTILAVYLLA